MAEFRVPVSGRLIAKPLPESGMNLLRIGVSKYALRTFAALVMYLVAAPQAEAGTIYLYEGTNFTLIGGSAPQVTTSDHLSGWVEFATAPFPNELVKTDVIAFSMTDGARTLSSANGDDQPFAAYFNFDASLTIIAWSFVVVPDGETNIDNVIGTQLVFDASSLNMGLVQNAFTRNPGTWTAAPSAVPEPASMLVLGTSLFGTGLFGAGLQRWRKRRA